MWFNVNFSNGGKLGSVTSCAQIDTHTRTHTHTQHTPAAREVVIVRTYPGGKTGMKNREEGGSGGCGGFLLLKTQVLR